MIVFRPDRLRHSNCREQLSLAPNGRTKTRPEPPCNVFEGLTQFPDSRPAFLIDVAENAKNTLSTARRGWKAIDVQSGVIFSPGLFPSGNLHGPQAGSRLVNAVAISRQERPNQAPCRGSVSIQECL